MRYRGRTGTRSCLKKRDAVNSKPVIFWCKRDIHAINTFSGRRGYSLYTQHERKPAGFISLSMFVDCFLVYGTYWWCSMADELGKEVERASVTLDTDGEWRTSVDLFSGVHAELAFLEPLAFFTFVFPKQVFNIYKYPSLSLSLYMYIKNIMDPHFPALVHFLQKSKEHV